MAYTQEEKREYFKRLRENWKIAKEYAKKEEYKAAYLEALTMGVKCSHTGWVFTKMQMEKLGLEGTPYIDTKTFKGWKESGYKVRKGEHSKINGMTFLSVKDEDDTKNERLLTYTVPKVYHLFHSSQVEAL